MASSGLHGALLAGALLLAPGAGRAQAPGPGDFPGCEWRAVAQGVGERLWCKAADGQWRRVTDEDDISRSDVEQARAGEPKAMVRLAWFYGADTPLRDEARALALLRKAADQGEPTAFYALGHFHEYGMGVPEDKTEAVRFYRMGAEKGDPEAMAHLGLALQYGQGATEDLREAVRWYLRAAEMGDLLATRGLAEIYSETSSPVYDAVQSARWRRVAAERGDGQSMNLLAYLLREGRGVRKDPAEAALWESRAQAQTIKDWMLDVERHGAGPHRGAFSGPNSAIELGDAWLKGEHGLKPDTAEALRWYRRAADAGDPYAMEILRDLYAEGKYVPADPAESARWEQRRSEAEFKALIDLADGGDVEAMKRLSVIYLTGKDVEVRPASGPDIPSERPKDPVQAARWMRRAAEAGDPESMSGLAMMYAQGVGVPKDEAEAKRWADKAAAADPLRYAPVESVIAGVDPGDPVSMVMLAQRLFAAGQPDEGVFWYYAAQLRAPGYVRQHPGAEQALGAIFATFGPGINQYAFGDIPRLIAVIDRLLAWDLAHPDPNGDEGDRAKAHKDLQAFRDKIVADQDKIRAGREKNGLPNAPR